jgi:hypothetical protein
LLASISPDALQEKDIRDALAGRFKPRPVEIPRVSSAKP